MADDLKSFAVEFSSDRQIRIEEGQSLLNASLDAGIPHFHICGGNARCSTCRVLVLEGEDSLTLPNEKEIQLKARMGFSDDVRLACQTSVKGNGVKLTRIIRDESDIDLYVGADAAVFTENIGTEIKLVIFFIDIRNFTEFVGSHLPFDIIHIMRKLFNCFHLIIERNKGKIIETMGDGLYAVFGFDEDINAGAEAAIRSGHEILSALEELNVDYFPKNFNQKIQVGIGMHTGTVVSGDICLGSQKHLLVMGYPVNVAARLQNATKELNNSFIVSSETLKLTGLTVSEYPSGIIQLRGVAEPVTVHLLGKAYPDKDRDVKKTENS